jgi:hypothetical protein
MPAIDWLPRLNNTITPAKLAPDLGIKVHLRSGNDAATMVEADINLRPLHTSIVDVDI